MLSLLVFIPEAKAPTYSTTVTILTSSADGYQFEYGTNWASIWNDNSAFATSDTTSTLEKIGYEDVGAAHYELRRGYVFFDTSSIPDEATITSANLSLYASLNEITTTQNLTIQNGMPTYPHSPLVASDFWKGWYSGDGGNLTVTSSTTLAYHNLTLNAVGLGWIDVDGTTKLILRTSLDIAGTTPTSGVTEQITFYSNEYGESYAPKLYIAYTGSYEAQYNIHGPYYENGYLAPYIVNVTYYVPNEQPAFIELNGSDGTADTYLLNATHAVTFFTWNITSPATNKTRTLYCTSATYEEVYIFIPNEDEPYYLYTFTVTDFAGITNGFLETVINVNGTNRAVERYSLDIINQIPFWMTWSHRYDLRLTADEGTYNYGAFIALNIQDQDIVITEDMFPEALPGQLISVNASRVNATWIQVNYTDTEDLTLWVHVNIKTRSGFGWTSVYTTNNTGQTQQVNWYSADAELDYLVVVTALRNIQMTWTFSCPKVSEATNPWTGILEILGDLPFPVVQLIGFLIVLAFGAIFSYVHIGVGCVVMTLIGGVLTYIGWLQLSVTAIAFALTVSVMVVLHEAKKREREI